MATIRKTITLSDSQDAWIKAQIARGAFTNDSEYIRDLVRRDQEGQNKLSDLRQAIAEGLAALGDSTPLRYAYARTLQCAGVLRQDGVRVTGKYCGNRWCVVCGRIRTAKQMAAYGPEIASWSDPWFVTLTVPNVTARDLHGTVRALVARLRQCAQNVRRRGLPFRAVRKLEVTYNVRARNYHPHLHLLVNSEAAGRALLAEWLRAWPEARPSAQDIRRGTSPMEVLKYAAKLTAKIDGTVTAPPARALDTIFKALRGLRSVQGMGFKVAAGADAAVQDDDGTLTLDASTPAPLARRAPTEWHWLPTLHDWVDLNTGEVLADFTPSRAHLALLDAVRRDAFPPD